MVGTIKHKSHKGFAFVRQQAANGNPVQDVFLHHTEYLGNWDTLNAGDVVEFTPGLRRGNPIAVDVKLHATAQNHRIQQLRNSVADKIKTLACENKESLQYLRQLVLPNGTIPFNELSLVDIEDQLNSMLQCWDGTPWEDRSAEDGAVQ
jgi:cold shock CspA family protein